MTPPTAPATGARRPPPDRRRLLDVGASGRRPWEFLPIAEDALRAAPDDRDLRLLLAANLGAVGLRTAALERLADAPRSLDADRDAQDLRRALESLPDDAVQEAALAAVCRRNADALRARGVDLARPLADWLAAADTRRAFRTTDGAVLLQRRGPDGRWGWTRLRDEAGVARMAALPDVTEGPEAADRARPWFLDGLDPALLRRALAATPPTSTGYEQRIVVVHEDEPSLLDALATADLRPAIAQPRTEWFLGAGATDRLAAWLRTRSDAIIEGPTLRAGDDASAGGDGPLAAVIARAAADQREEHAALLARVRAMDGARDAAFWARRYAQALAPATASPLRVLVPTCRYTTFVRHSAEDIAEACRRLGHEARVLIEPDASSRLSSVAYLREFARWDPDLVVLINYPRAALGDAAPTTTPFVCWVQDAMGRLYDPALGAAQTPLDFLVGCLNDDLFDLFGYPRERAFPTPPLVSDAKFHPGPTREPDRERFACEAAYVGHQSEPPDAMRDRLLRELAAQPPARRALERMLPAIDAYAADPMRACTYEALQPAARDALAAELGREPDPRAVSTVLTQAALPLADRTLRHATLAWAADIAQSRGWRLRLFGKGWDRHPTLRAFAAGALEHGEELRACYQAAAAHLHVSPFSLVHQRVLECALSGGLPLCRLQRDEVHHTEAWITRETLREPNDLCAVPSRWQGWRGWDRPLLMRLWRMRQRLGLDVNHTLWLSPEQRAAHERSPVIPRDQQADWLLGDLAEHTFTSRDGLERLLALAVERPAWRRNLSEGVAARVRERLTYRAFLRRLLPDIAASLARTAAARPGPKNPLCAP